MHEASAAIKAAHPKLISEVLSLADVLMLEKKTTSKPDTAPESPDAPDSNRARPSGLFGGLLGGSPPGEATPDQVLQTKLTFLGTPGFSQFLSNFWDRPTGQMRLLVRIRESADAEHKQRAFDGMFAIGQTRFGPRSNVTGLSHLMTQVTRAIITTQFQSTAWACAAILVMLALALRSVLLALLALLPTVLAIGLVLGVMGWLGIKIDLSTALVASVAMGLSVDDTFHCLFALEARTEGRTDDRRSPARQLRGRRARRRAFQRRGQSSDSSRWLSASSSPPPTSACSSPSPRSAEASETSCYSPHVWSCSADGLVELAAG